MGLRDPIEALRNRPEEAPRLETAGGMRYAREALDASEGWPEAREVLARCPAALGTEAMFDRDAKS